MEQDKSTKNRVGELVRESLISDIKRFAETEKEEFHSLTVMLIFW